MSARLSHDEKEQIRRMYRDGSSTMKIAFAMGRHPETVRNYKPKMPSVIVYQKRRFPTPVEKCEHGSDIRCTTTYQR